MSVCVPAASVSVRTGSERQCAYRQRASVCVPAASVSQCAYRQRASVCVPTASVSVRTGSERQCAYRQRASVCVPAASVSVRTGNEHVRNAHVCRQTTGRMSGTSAGIYLALIGTVLRDLASKQTTCPKQPRAAPGQCRRSGPECQSGQAMDARFNGLT